jgi:hypothetical protein
MALID